LKALPDGKLVVPNAWSPEHDPDEDGVNYSQEIIWDLFNNYVQAADALAVDTDYRDKILAMRDRLATPGIGSWGQLLEWATEKCGTNAIAKMPELDTPNDHHRHTSHLFGVYPCNQISFTKTPALAAAAKVSLDARGINTDSDVREWSFAWRTALYARLQDGENAHHMLQQIFSAWNTCPNLFGLHGGSKVFKPHVLVGRTRRKPRLSPISRRMAANGSSGFGNRVMIGSPIWTMAARARSFCKAC
jgi:alpha-L-fucosidase 2